jgi:hypothetical protein
LEDWPPKFVKSKRDVFVDITTKKSARTYLTITSHPSLDPEKQEILVEKLKCVNAHLLSLSAPYPSICTPLAPDNQ